MNGDTEETAIEEINNKDLSSPKPESRKWIGVNIKLADGHYLATFNHDVPRIFHSLPRLLTAIEVETAKLGPGPTQT
jgi:hypothetical protein